RRWVGRGLRILLLVKEEDALDSIPDNQRGIVPHRRVFLAVVCPLLLLDVPGEDGHRVVGRLHLHLAGLVARRLDRLVAGEGDLGPGKRVALPQNPGPRGLVYEDDLQWLLRLLRQLLELPPAAQRRPAVVVEQEWLLALVHDPVDTAADHLDRPL